MNDSLKLHTLFSVLKIIDTSKTTLIFILIRATRAVVSCCRVVRVSWCSGSRKPETQTGLYFFEAV